MSYDSHFKKLKKKASGKPVAQQKQRSSAPIGQNQKPKAKTQRPKSQQTPWLLFSTLIIGTLVSFLGYNNLDHVDRFISRVEIGFLGQASAEEAMASASSPKQANNADAPPVVGEAQCSPATVVVPEELSHYSNLAERKQQLDLREQELAKLEEELQKQKAEVETRIQKLESVRADISGILKERVEVDEQRVATLVDFYSNMKPKQAAEIFNDLNEDLAIEVLGRMKKKNAAEIMNLLEPAKAKVLSEKFTGYKKR